MSPKSIVGRAKEAGLDIIAITDHNMAENSVRAGGFNTETGAPLVLFGMELQTVEELHLLIILGDEETAMELQQLVYHHLPDLRNDPEYFGDQVVLDEQDEIVRFEERLLLNSSTLPLDEAVAWVKAKGGLAIPSHIDSPTFSIISQLGYVPDDLPFDALEVARTERVKDILAFILPKDIPLVSFSDAHYLKDIGKRRIRLTMDEPSFAGVAEALKGFGNTARMIAAGVEGPGGC
jgi:3',5'-nucleoside bisphosphate phosphatase